MDYNFRKCAEIAMCRGRFWALDPDGDDGEEREEFGAEEGDSELEEPGSPAGGPTDSISLGSYI
jgi:hypothetical protein